MRGVRRWGGSFSGVAWRFSHIWGMVHLLTRDVLVMQGHSSSPYSFIKKERRRKKIQLPAAGQEEQLVHADAHGQTSGSEFLLDVAPPLLTYEEVTKLCKLYQGWLIHPLTSFYSISPVYCSYYLGGKTVHTDDASLHQWHTSHQQVVPLSTDAAAFTETIILQ